MTPATTTPLSKVSAQIKQQLDQGLQQQIASDFQTNFVNKWTARTFCANGLRDRAVRQLHPAGHAATATTPATRATSTRRAARPSCPRSRRSRREARRCSRASQPRGTRRDRSGRRPSQAARRGVLGPSGAPQLPPGAAPQTRAAARHPARRLSRGSPRACRPASGHPDPLEALRRLDEITRRLRRECPWDREQDERSIVPHTVEEAYELADAAADGDDAKLLDELGDVLFQVHFLSLLLEERGAGSLAEVAEGTSEKLIRRHPHVFGEAQTETAGEVLRNWDRIKREQEGRGADDPFADVPENLPALLYARKVQRRAASAGLEGAEPADERLGDPEQRDAAEAWVGDTLFALVDMARRMRVDPELALRGAARRFRDRLSDG